MIEAPEPDQTRLIESAWQEFLSLAVLPDAPPEQISTMRFCFFAGAQMLFTSIISVFNSPKPTEQDQARMSFLYAELMEFHKSTQPAISEPQKVTQPLIKPPTLAQ